MDLDLYNGRMQRASIESSSSSALLTDLEEEPAHDTEMIYTGKKNTKRYQRLVRNSRLEELRSRNTRNRVARTLLKAAGVSPPTGSNNRYDQFDLVPMQSPTDEPVDQLPELPLARTRKRTKNKLYTNNKKHYNKTLHKNMISIRIE